MTVRAAPIAVSAACRSACNDASATWRPGSGARLSKPERVAQAAVVVAERRLVAAESDVGLRARAEAALDVEANGEVLRVDRAHQQVEVAVPVPLLLVGDRRASA